MADTEQTNLTALTVDLLSAYFANNTLDSAQLSGLIRTTHEALKGIDSPAPETPPEPEFKAAVTARKSLSSADHILSLIDGKPYKTLKRHLSGHGLTPAEYRERYKLPADYPMVAPAYSQQRRDVAARLGLGRKPREPQPDAVEPPAAVDVAPAPAPAPKVKPAARAASVKKLPAKAKVDVKPAAPKAAAKPRVKSAAASVEPSAEVATESKATVPEASVPAAPKKASARKPKAPATSAGSATAPKPAAKRAPRKAKPAPEPAAG